MTLPTLQGGPARARMVFAYHTIYEVSCPYHSSRGALAERGGYSQTILFIRFRAPPTPPGRPRQSEDSIREPYCLSGLVPLPPLQGSPASARTVFANHIIYQVSCPYHASREAPPERGGYPNTILFIRFRAPPTPPGKPRLSEEGTPIPYYLQGVVRLLPLQGGPA